MTRLSADTGAPRNLYESGLAPLRVLLAPSTPQIDSDDDFDFTDEGEILVTSQMVCEGVNPEGYVIADLCGCGRSFVGLRSARSTTVATIGNASLAEVNEQITSTALDSEIARNQVRELDELLQQLDPDRPVRVRVTPSSFCLIQEPSL